ncbi:MAG TPA: hypothetical protein VLM80_03755 [Anaerolineales bacterium]|nr:hypothetical protein [Anaerolineales bacterium]
MNNSIETPPQLLRFAPIIALLGWLVFCGACVFTVLIVPRQLIAQLPAPIISLTIPATTTPRPSRTPSPIFSITPTQETRRTIKPEASISPTGSTTLPGTEISQTYTPTLLQTGESPASLTPPPETGSITPSTTSSGAAINLVSISSPIAPGGLASLSIQTIGGAICQINFVSPLGNPLIAEGLTSTRADSSGNCTWSWLIPAALETGEARITVTAAGSSETFVMVITSPNQGYP